MADHSIDLQVNNDLDDIYEEQITYQMYNTVEIVHRADEAGYGDYAGHRWVSNSLPPKGSTITACYVTLVVKSTTFDDIYGSWRFEKTTSPARFTLDNYDITNRTLTNSYVEWHEDSIGTGWKNTSSLVSPLQEVIDLYSPTALVLVFVPGTPLSAKEFITYSYSATSPGGTLAAEIHIEWTEKTGPLPMYFR